MQLMNVYCNRYRPERKAERQKIGSKPFFFLFNEHTQTVRNLGIPARPFEHILINERENRVEFPF